MDFLGKACYQMQHLGWALKDEEEFKRLNRDGGALFPRNLGGLSWCLLLPPLRAATSPSSMNTRSLGEVRLGMARWFCIFLS